MKQPFKVGDRQTYAHTVEEADLASFHGKVVHPVYSTFALARDAEWCCRLFVLEMKEEEEEGVGAAVSVVHLGPAKLGETVNFTAEITELRDNKIVCQWHALCQGKSIAKGTQTQHIINKKRFYDKLKLDKR